MSVVYLRILGVLAGAGMDACHTDIHIALVKGGQIVDTSVGTWKIGICPGQPVGPLKMLYPELDIYDYTDSRDALRLDHVRDVLYKWSPIIEPDGLDTFIMLNPEHIDVIYSELTKLNAFLLTAGVAENKFLAKVAGLEAYKEACRYKRLGVVTKVIKHDKSLEFLSNLPLRLLWPIPPDIREEISRAGLRNMGEIASVDESELTLRFGKWGRIMARLAQGKDDSPVQCMHPRLTKEVTFNFDSPVIEHGYIDAILKKIAQNLGEALLSAGYACNCLTLNVQTEKGGIVTKKILQPPRSNPSGLLPALESMVNKVIRLSPISITAKADGLVTIGRKQIPLFEKPDQPATELKCIDSAMKALEKRYAKPVGWYGRKLPSNWIEEMLYNWDPLRKGFSTP